MKSLTVKLSIRSSLDRKLEHCCYVWAGKKIKPGNEISKCHCVLITNRQNPINTSHFTQPHEADNVLQISDDETREVLMSDCGLQLVSVLLMSASVSLKRRGEMEGFSCMVYGSSSGGCVCLAALVTCARLHECPSVMLRVWILSACWNTFFILEHG